jgi:hypothetical protein
MDSLKKAFWPIYLSFCAFATLFLYTHNSGGMAEPVFVLAYLLVGWLIHLYVKSNAEAIRNWFN